MERITELEAVNKMLLDIRLAPLASIDTLDVYHEATIAKNELDMTTRAVVAKGWNFNTRYLTLQPDINGNIYVPENTIEVFVPEGYSSLMVQDGKLQDMLTNSQVFTAPVSIYVVLGFDFAALPSPLQNYCLAEARLEFVTSMRADTQVPAGLSNTIRKTQALAKAWDLRQKRLSMLDNIYSRVHTNRSYPRR